MPYYVYKVHPARRFEQVQAFERYREARDLARQMRAALREQDSYTVRVMFAASPAEAERQMAAHREAPPLGEDG